MRKEGFEEIDVFIPSLFPSNSCGQITNPTGKFPIKVIKQKWHRRMELISYHKILARNINNY